MGLTHVFCCAHVVHTIVVHVLLLKIREMFFTQHFYSIITQPLSHGVRPM
jgi:hypothetical protein